MGKRKDSNGRVLPDGVSERADGRYLYRYQKYGKTHYIYDRDLNELKRKIGELQLDVAKGINTNLASMTMNEWYPQYLKIYKEGKIKETSMVNKRNYYKWYVEPYDLGRMPLRDINRPFVINHFQWLADNKKLSHGTLRSLASMLFNAMQEVQYSGGVIVNPFVDIMVNVRSRPEEKRIALSVEEQQALIEYLKENGFQNVYLPIIGVMLGTAMRIGEVLALTWEDIDFKNNVIHIYKTLNYRTRIAGKGHEYFITTPKTKNANRDIPMSPDVCKLLYMQQQYQKDLRIRQDIQIPQRDDTGNCIRNFKGFVFTSKLGYPFTHEGFKKSVERIVKNYNTAEKKAAENEKRDPIYLPNITPHVFRHTACTRLVEQEIPYERLKLIMGHSSLKTTIDVYTSISNDLRKKAQFDLENIVSIF